jgi:hypothetical protein
MAMKRNTPTWLSATTGVVVLGLAVGGAGWAMTGPAKRRPAQWREQTAPAATSVQAGAGSPAREVDPADPMLAVDLTDATIDLVAPPAGCPAGPIRFRPYDDKGYFDAGRSRAEFSPWTAAIGDLDGDRRAEAVLALRCTMFDVVGGLNDEYLVVVRRTSGRSLVSVASTVLYDEHLSAMWISGGTLHADVRGPAHRLTEVRSWHLRAPELEPVTDGAGESRIALVDLRPVAAEVDCPPAAGDPVRLDGGAQAQVGDWQVSLESNVDNRVWAELGRPGRPYLLLELECRRAGATGPGTRRIVIFDAAGAGAWVALDVIAERRIDQIRGRQVVTGAEFPSVATVAYTWDGKAFRR